MASFPTRSDTPSPALPLPAEPPRDPEAELEAFWNGRTVSLVVMCTCAIIVSGIAIAILFTPIGAGVVAAGILIGCAAITGLFGFGSLLAVLITHGILKGEVAQITMQRALDQALDQRRTDANDSLLAVIAHFGHQIIDTQLLFVTKSPKNYLNALRTELPTEFKSHTYNNTPHLLANYLKTLFLPWKNDPSLILLNLKGFNNPQWEKLSQDAANATNHPHLINDLQKLFSETPLSAIYFILLLHEVCKANKHPDAQAAILAREALNPILQLDVSHLFSDASENITLAQFIIAHADQIFSERYARFKDVITPTTPTQTVRLDDGTLIDSEDD